MKKRWIIPMIMTSAVLLMGCGKKEEKLPPMEAMYIEKGDHFSIFVDTRNDSPFTANIPEETADLTTGDIVYIYGNGIMLESYPGQYPGVTKIEIIQEGKEEDAEKYSDLVEELYEEPNPAEPPYLSLEYSTELANVSTVGVLGSYHMEYTDEDGNQKISEGEAGDIQEWEELYDLSVTEPVDVYLNFTDQPESVAVFYYAKGEKEGKEIDLTEEEDSFYLKGLEKPGRYLVKAVFQNGEAEYGFMISES